MTTEQTKLSVGEQLKQARVTRATTCADVAAKLKLDEWIIQALEADDYSRLPAPIFTRGYLRSYASLMGLDADALAASYKGDTGAVTPLSVNTAGDDPKTGKRWLSWFFAFVVIALLGLFLAWYSQDNGWREDATQATGQTSEPTTLNSDDEGEVVNVVPPVINPNAEEQPSDAAVNDTEAETNSGDVEPVAAGTPAPAPSQPESQPESASETTSSESASNELPVIGFPTVAASAGASSSAPSEPASAAVVETPVVEPAPQPEPTPEPVVDDRPRLTLLVRASGKAWIAIRDADGTKLVYDLKQDGYEQEVSGVPPLKVHLGNAPSVELLVDGVEYPHRRFWRSNNTAKFNIRKAPE